VKGAALRRAQSVPLVLACQLLVVENTTDEIALPCFIFELGVVKEVEQMIDAIHIISLRFSC
jgi:hypothetical protein